MRWPLWRVAVVESSMEPTLMPGDWLLVRRPVRRGRGMPVKPGQVVVARHPQSPGMLIVKRVVWREPDGWWLASDNPRAAGARDSGSFGTVPGDLVEGRVLMRYRRRR